MDGVFNLLVDHLFSLLSEQLDERGVRLLILFSWVCAQAGDGAEVDAEILAEILRTLGR